MMAISCAILFEIRLIIKTHTESPVNFSVYYLCHCTSKSPITHTHTPVRTHTHACAHTSHTQQIYTHLHIHILFPLCISETTHWHIASRFLREEISLYRLIFILLKADKFDLAEHPSKIEEERKITK